LIAGVVVYMGIFVLSVPIFLWLRFNDANWLFLLFASAAATGIPMSCGLYYANHNNYGSGVYVPGEVDIGKVSWGANTYIPASNVHRISVDENDPDFQNGMVEVDNHLDEKKDWDKRLNAAKRRGR